MKKFRFSLLLLAALLLFAACKELPALKPTQEGYRFSDGTLYCEAPMNYLAATRSKNAVARLVDATGERALYDAKDGLLCDENGELFAPKDFEFPLLLTFSANRVSICKEENLRVELAFSTDEELLKHLAGVFYFSDLHLTRDDLPQGFAATRYLLLFSSESYSNLFYRMEYLVFEKGEDPYAEWSYDADWVAFLYDREQDFYVFAHSALYDLVSGDLS